MKPILHILVKVWVQQFYQRNAGFFLFLFVVLFGVVQNPLMYHYKLMEGIVTSYSTLLFATIAWLLYAAKCGIMVLHSIAKQKAWLCQLQAVPAKQLALSLVIAQAMLFLPATVYILFTIGAGIYLNQFFAAVILLLLLLFIHILSAALYYQCLFGKDIKVRLLKKPIFTYQLPKGFFSFLLWYNFYKGKLKMVAVKFFSFLLLFIPLVWNNDHVELSDFVLFFQLSIAAHAIIVYDSVHFLEKDFRVLRNVPVSLYKMFLLFLITYIILLLPEVFFLWFHGNQVHLGVSVPSLVLYFIGQLLLFTALAYEKHQKIQNYLLYIGLITVCSLLLTPLKSFGWIRTALIMIAFTLFHSNYYKYEPDYSLTDSTEKHR